MDDFFSSLVPSAGQDGPGWEDAPFLARLTSKQNGTGAQASLILYGFTEQSYDPTTGFPVDANPARTDNLSLGATTYALEVSNQSLTVPGSTPSGFTNPGPYVWLRLRGAVEGGLVYEFDAGQSTGGGGIALLDKTGATVDASCSSLKMDADGVIIASNLSAGHDQFSVTDAGTSQRGVVSITTQTFGGVKTFNDGLVGYGPSGSTGNTVTAATFHGKVIVDDGATIGFGAAGATGHIGINPANSEPIWQNDGAILSVQLIGAGVAGFPAGGGGGILITSSQFAYPAIGLQGGSGGFPMVYGKTGTDPVGNTFTGGVLTAFGSASGISGTFGG